MANTKQCNDCCKTLPITEFSKRKASPDGLQLKCKSCNKKDNKKFRYEINPQHHAEWQRNNRERANELVTAYRKGDKAGVIYYIVNPNGEYYVGMTKTPFSVRMLEHKIKYRRWKEGKGTYLIPNLYQSLNKWGWEGHRTGIIIKDETVDRKELKKWEKECILFFKGIGKSLNEKL